MSAPDLMRVIHSFTDDSAVIRIEGLAKPVRMLHLTDTHLRFFDERDGERYEGCVPIPNALKRCIESGVPSLTP